MPDPIGYGQSLAVALLAGLLSVAVGRRCLRRLTPSGNALAEVLGVACAAAVGLSVLHIRPRWPPLNGLDRYLAIVLPIALLVELLAASRATKFVTWLRLVGAAAFVGVLLYGSVHLKWEALAWSGEAMGLWLPIWSFGLFAAWELQTRFVRRTGDVVMPLAVALATLSAGLLIMMAGYLKGGATAFPLAGALAGAAWWGRRAESPIGLSGATGWGIVALGGLVMIGRYFGGLTQGTALAVFVAPLLTWFPSHAPPLRRRAWLRLIIVVVVLGILLDRGKREFDRKMRPLLRSAPVAKLAHAQAARLGQGVGASRDESPAWHIRFAAQETPIVHARTSHN